MPPSAIKLFILPKTTGVNRLSNLMQFAKAFIFGLLLGTTTDLTFSHTDDFGQI